MSFLQFFADVSKRSKAAIAICVYASESSGFAHLQNGIGYKIRVYKILAFEVDEFC